MAVAVRQRSKRRLYRSRDAYVGGVCAGIANYCEVDPLVIRIMAVLLMVVTAGLASIAYLVLWAHVPLEPDKSGPYDVMVQDAKRASHHEADLYLVTDDEGQKELVRLPLRGLSLLSRVVIVVALGALALATALLLGLLVPGVPWWNFWPVLPFITGLFFIVVPVRSRHCSAWRAAGIMLAASSIAVLPICTGLVSPRTIPYAIQLFWPLLLAAAILFVVGVWSCSSAVTMFGAFGFIAFCAVSAACCIIPGPIGLLDTALGGFGAPSLGVFFI